MNNLKQIRKNYLGSFHKRDLYVSVIILIGTWFLLGSSYCQECKAKAEGKPTIAEVLVKVANNGNLEKLQLMVEKHNVDINQQLENQETVLTLASYHGYPDMVKYLLSKEAKIDTRNKWNNTALSNASMKGHTNIVAMLLKGGADINEKCNDGKTPLHYAIQNDHAETVGLLLDAGADVNILNKYNQSPVLTASWHGNPEIIYNLIKHGADINFKTNQNNSVLHNLAGGGYTKSVKIALENGANANQLDNNGRLPLHNAVINRHSDVVNLLIPKTTDINQKETTLGNTPLHIAAINGDNESSKVLFEAKANPKIKNNKGKTPLDYAVKYGYINLVTYYAENNLATKSDIVLTKDARKAANSELVDGQAKVIYTGHSGWIVQTDNNVLIFDYWSRNSNPESCLANGSFCGKEMKDKNVYVFVSHEHSDHFDTTIYAWADQIKNITYIFGFKPEESWIYKDKAYNGPAYQYIADNKVAEVKNLSVTTIKSNDSGQGFLVESDGITIYHPGDHALFTAEDRPVFEKEVDFIAEISKNIDIAFLPVTGCPSRWKKEFIVEGFFYTIDKLNPKKVYPMHAFQREYTLKEFAELAEERKSTAEIICAENRGDNFLYTNNLTAKK